MSPTAAVMSSYAPCTIQPAPPPISCRVPACRPRRPSGWSRTLSSQPAVSSPSSSGTLDARSMATRFIRSSLSSSSEPARKPCSLGRAVCCTIFFASAAPGLRAACFGVPWRRSCWLWVDRAAMPAATGSHRDLGLVVMKRQLAVWFCGQEKRPSFGSSCGSGGSNGRPRAIPFGFPFDSFSLSVGLTAARGKARKANGEVQRRRPKRSWCRGEG